MTINLHRAVRLGLALALGLTATASQAALQDHGTADPVINFPVWYRDLNGVAVQQCRSTTSSPNAAAGLIPMCFPFAADPAGFPGNIGGELFYSDANVSLLGPAFTLRYTAALEMAYATGVPTKGQEIVFARIRIVIAPTIPGTYKVTHPYGVEIFPDVGTGPRAVFFTEDIVPIPGNFDAALDGRIGPFLQWDSLLPGESLTNSAGEQFLGDPNYVHTFTGSPFGTNYVRVDGPAGSNLDGVGNDFIQTPLASILGQKYLAPIPSPLRVNRAVYSRDPTKSVNSVDVWATAPTGAKLLLTGTDLPSVAMKSSGNSFFAHVEIPATIPLPAGISVTNVSDNPPTTVTAGLGDAVNITSATFDTLSNTITVTAVSSDLSVPPPALAVEGLFGGPMTAGSYTAVLPATSLPPTTVSVVSAAGGVDTDDLIILRGLPLNPASPPVAVADTIATNSNVAATVSLTANDTVAAAPLASLVITQVPTNGTVTVDPATLGTVTYTPALNFSGPDNFSYVITDSAGAVSNVGFVTVTVTFAAAPPVANGDNWAQVRGSTRTVSVIANDKAGTGTTLDAASVLVGSAPLHGSATPNPDGTISYTPIATYVGADTFTYTVKNNAGQASNAATVSVVVSTQAETLVFQRVLFTTRTGSYTIVGSTSVFGPTLTPSVTCWMGRTAGVAANLIGKAPVTATGGFSVVSVGAVPAPDATRSVVCQSTNGAVVAVAVALK